MGLVLEGDSDYLRAAEPQLHPEDCNLSKFRETPVCSLPVCNSISHGLIVALFAASVVSDHQQPY